MKKQNNKKGITLAELLLAMVITVIVIGAAGTSFILGQRIYNHSAQTAVEQKELKVAEMVLRENAYLMIWYGVGDYEAANPPAGASDMVSMYFEDGELIIQLYESRMSAAGIEKLTLDFELVNGVGSMKYRLETRGIEQNGVVVMNNIKTEDRIIAAQCVLTKENGKLFQMKIPGN